MRMQRSKAKTFDTYCFLMEIQSYDLRMSLDKIEISCRYTGDPIDVSMLELIETNMCTYSAIEYIITVK